MSISHRELEQLCRNFRVSKVLLLNHIENLCTYEAMLEGGSFNYKPRALSRDSRETQVFAPDELDLSGRPKRLRLGARLLSLMRRHRMQLGNLSTPR